MKVFKYSFLDLTRNRWSLFYLLFFLLTTWGLLYLSGDTTRTIASLLNMVLFLVPLVCSVFSLMYSYQVSDYIEVIISQPVSRLSVFSGLYASLALTLSLCLVLGIGLPFAIFALNGYPLQPAALAALIACGVLLSAVFAALAMLIALKNEHRIKGFAWVLLIWFFMAILYDGGLLIAFMAFEDYPLDNLALAGVLLNPVDMSRILVIYQIDLSALLGYTGAVFQQFFNKSTGSLLIAGSFFLWLIAPVLFLLRAGERKDF